MEKAGAMGWDDNKFNSSTMPEFIHFFRGWQRSKGIDPDDEMPMARKPMTIAEAEMLFEKHG